MRPRTKRRLNRWAKALSWCRRSATVIKARWTDVVNAAEIFAVSAGALFNEWRRWKGTAEQGGGERLLVESVVLPCLGGMVGLLLAQVVVAAGTPLIGWPAGGMRIVASCRNRVGRRPCSPGTEWP